MSSFLNPVGPEEPSTYWRRRAIVVVALLVILLLLWWIFKALFGSDSESPPDGATPAPSSAAMASVTPTASPSSAAPTATTPSGAASAVARCAESDIDVLVGTAGGSTASGEGMRLTLKVVNTGKAPCRRDVGAGANELVVTSGSAVIWSSESCQPGRGSDSVTLKPAKPWTTSASWPGRVTTRDCPADQPVAKAGTYRVQGRNGSVQSALVRFVVS